MILLAPMEGVIDFVMRDLLTRAGGIDFCATEFIRVTHQLNPEHVFLDYCPELKTGGRTSAGVPVFVQILGGQPPVMAENAARAAELGAPGIDLNFGCPAKTVNRHDGGSVILQWPDRVFKITEAVRRAVPEDIPVTVKIRLGYENSDLSLDNALAAEAGGAFWLTVHARTKVDGYKPPAHWEKLVPLREKLKIPLIANGEMWTAEDAGTCRRITGCDRLMLGRGMIADPFLALRVRGMSAPDGWEPLRSLLVEFTEKTRLWGDEGYAVARCKQWLRLLARNSPAAGLLFDRIKRYDRLAPLQEALRPSH